MGLLGVRALSKATRTILSIVAVFSLLLYMCAPALAAGGIQGNLLGTVLDAATNAPIANVSVTATSPSGNFHASTDAAGHFSLLGMPPDTYAVNITKEGYSSASIPGVAVFGDETDSVGVIHLTRAMKTIANVRSSSAGAFQPNQTQDTTTISGARITQALGNPNSQNEQNLILAAPGAMLDAQGAISVRGSLNTESGLPI